MVVLLFVIRWFPRQVSRLRKVCIRCLSQPVIALAAAWGKRGHFSTHELMTPQGIDLEISVVYTSPAKSLKNIAVSSRFR